MAANPPTPPSGDHDRAPAHGLLAMIANKVTSFLKSDSEQILYSVTINASPEDVYAFYRDLEQLPRFMDYLGSVTVLDERMSHWVAKLPGGEKAEWDAEIVQDVPGEVLAWRSVKGSAHDVRGRVTFTRAPGRDMTEVRVAMSVGGYGAIAKVVAKPQVKADLRRLKQVIETGEVLKSDASIHAGLHPAQPDDKAVQS
jgi:uncharacterized membrane protein